MARGPRCTCTGRRPHGRRAPDGPISDVFDEEEEVAQLCDVDGTAEVKLDRIGSGGRRESPASMVERYHEEKKFNLNSNTS